MKKISSAILTAALLASAAQAQNLVPKWNANPIGANQNFCNGMGYVPSTGHLIVPVCAGSTATIYRIDAATGATLSGNLSTTGISGGTFIIGGLTAASDGVIYACNYGAAGATKIYSWANEGAAPVQVGPTVTIGSGSVGKNITVYGTGNNAVFLISTTATGAVYVHYNGSAWVAAQLTVSTQSCQSQMSFVNWSATSCRFVTKNSSASGYSCTFNPSASSPIAVTQTGISGFSSGTGTIQNVAYDPTTGLMGTITRTLGASPFTVTMNTWATGHPSGTITSPVAQTPQTANAAAADAGTIGASCWADGRFYCVPAVSSLGIYAFDVSPFAITNMTPTAETVPVGQTTTFSVVAGGSDSLSYNWQLNGVDVSGGEFSGATTPTLTISPVGNADAGTYTCTVTGINGTTWTSSNGVLTVGTPKSTPSFANLTATPSAIYGSTSVTLGGTVSAAGPVYPASGETITVTINGHAQTTTTSDAVGDFSINYNPSSPTKLAASGTPYTITYSYAGDSSLNAASDTSTALTVGKLPVVLTGTRAYDGTATATSSILSVTDKVAGDDVTVASGSATLADSSVGTHAITSPGTLALGGTTAPNYTLSGATGSVIITDPGLPFSFSSATLDNTGTHLVLVWDTIPGDAYQLMSSTDLINWVNYGGSVTATAALTTNTVPINAASSEFFKYKNLK